MNDKKFIKTKVMKSLKKLFGKKNLSSYELTRLHILGSMVSAVLFTGRSELAQMALGNFERKQHASKVKQYKRFVMNGHVGLDIFFCLT